MSGRRRRPERGEGCVEGTRRTSCSCHDPPALVWSCDITTLHLAHRLCFVSLMDRPVQGGSQMRVESHMAAFELSSIPFVSSPYKGACTR